MVAFGYAASILMGLILGMMGGGGAILTVPILVYIFEIEPLQATAYSLFIVGSTALIGGLSYLRGGQVNLKTGLIFAVPSFIGVYGTRAFLVPRLPETVFHWGDVAVSRSLLIMGAFAAVMILASMTMIRGMKKKMDAAAAPWERFVLVPAQGLIVGSVSGFVGAGGGFLIVPALVILVGMPMKVAVGTSLFIIATNSLFGFVGDLQHAPVIDWTLLFTVAGLAVSGLFVGRKLSARISEATLKRGFGYFVLVMGTVILFDQIHKL